MFAFYFLFGLLVTYGSALVPPSWPASYIIQGVLRLPYAEINEPFTAYWDAKAGNSRIDYYGNTVVTIQRASKKAAEYGMLVKVAPMSTEKVLNERGCFLVNGSADTPVSIQSILPDLTNFTLVSTAMLRGHNCDVWRMVATELIRKNTYTMWVEQGTGTPVRYTMVGYDTLLGSHYDRYYLDYNGYVVTPIPPVTFDLPTGIKCGDFPGPGYKQERMLEVNPMGQFIHRSDDGLDHMFDHFKQKHAKSYHSKVEHAQRKMTFLQNVRFIHSTNRAGRSFALAVNHLADASNAELGMMRGRRRSTGYNGGRPFNKTIYSQLSIPTQFDWRIAGAVTPVKDQAVCGSCWSFGTTGTIEGANFLKTSRLVRLSQQQLMDCSWGEGNNACDGGEDFRAYEWIERHGLSSQDNYGPYIAQDGYCRLKNDSSLVWINGYVNVTTNDSDALKIALLKKGPISVSIDASHKSLVFYSNGIYYEPKCGSSPDDLDHSVLAVGYGELNGEAYWLIKNSWSTYWGNDGYVLMAQRGNNCGVATTPTFVIIK